MAYIDDYQFELSSIIARQIGSEYESYPFPMQEGNIPECHTNISLIKPSPHKTPTAASSEISSDIVEQFHNKLHNKEDELNVNVNLNTNLNCNFKGESNISENECKDVVKKDKRMNTHKQRGPKVNLDGVVIHNRKHLNVERKKHRIQFQKNHNKVIYSYFDLTAPIDFDELFELVLQHQSKGYTGPGKSFHFIRVNGEVKVVTFKEKRKIKKKMKEQQQQSQHTETTGII